MGLGVGPFYLYPLGFYESTISVCCFFCMMQNKRPSQAMADGMLFFCEWEKREFETP